MVHKAEVRVFQWKAGIIITSCCGASVIMLIILKRELSIVRVHCTANANYTSLKLGQDMQIAAGGIIVHWGHVHGIQGGQTGSLGHCCGCLRRLIYQGRKMDHRCQFCLVPRLLPETDGPARIFVPGLLCLGGAASVPATIPLAPTWAS